LYINKRPNLVFILLVNESKIKYISKRALVNLIDVLEVEFKVIINRSRSLYYRVTLK